MKLIIAGSRTLHPTVEELDELINLYFTEKITEVVSGTAAGVDHCGEIWAEHKGLPVTQFPADWANLGRKAGPIRNAAMAAYADALLLYWDGQSRGSASMLKLMKRAGKPVLERFNPAKPVEGL